MQPLTNSIIFIGFKNVGKTTIARELARQLAMPFIDLDEEIEKTFAKEQQKKQTCREIMRNYGAPYFRDLEKRVFHKVIQGTPAIIALGGGAPAEKSTQILLQGHTVIHVKALRHLVFKRIMASGHPAIFSADRPPLESFTRLWNKRQRIYKKLATFSIQNNGPLQSSIEQILKQLNIRASMD